MERYRYLIRINQQAGDAYQLLKAQLGKALLLGLEFLVAADIIRTVALEPNTAERNDSRLARDHPHVSELVIGRGDRRALAVAEASEECRGTSVEGNDA